MTEPSSHNERQWPTYVVVTPARNEAPHIPSTIDAMRSQVAHAERWVIVDDGSTDGTTEIAQQAAEEESWISTIQRKDRGFRAAGSGVVDAVNDGIESLGDSPWEYMVKLDADLSFGRDYFAQCLDAFDADPTLGIAGGTVYNIGEEGERIAEPHPRFHVRGATKIYRRACWDQIGGLTSTPGWDTIDEVTANRLGWTTRTLPIPIDQLRTTGAAAGQWQNWVKNGRAANLSGYHPAFVVARAASRLGKPPYATAATGLLWGYARSAISREPKAVDATTARYVRQQQLNRLLGRDTIWR